jgi:hypothetical protein
MPSACWSCSWPLPGSSRAEHRSFSADEADRDLLAGQPFGCLEASRASRLRGIQGRAKPVRNSRRRKTAVPATDPGPDSVADVR